MCSVSGSTFAYGTLVWFFMSGMWWKRMSMADELPREPNMEVAPFFSAGFFRHVPKMKILRMVLILSACALYGGA
jgi:hypothetical protein